MRRDIQLLVPLVLFGLSFLAVAMGLLLLTGLKWEAVLEDVGLIEPTEIGDNVPLSTSDLETILSGDSIINIPLPEAHRSKAIAPAPTLTPTFDPAATAAALERKPHFPGMRTGVEDIDRFDRPPPPWKIQELLDAAGSRRQPLRVWPGGKSSILGGYRGWIGGEPPLQCERDPSRATDIDVRYGRSHCGNFWIVRLRHYK